MTVLTLPVIRVVNDSEMPFTTLGHWKELDSGQFEILVLNMPDWRLTLIVLLHELTEWAICQRDKVNTADCDRFDEWFEKEYESERIPLSVEAGCDSRCPYHKGHMWGIRVERLFCWLLGLKWRVYCGMCQGIFDNLWALHHET